LFDQHEFNDVQLFVLDPVDIELLEDDLDLLHDLHDGLVVVLLADALVRLLRVEEQLAEVFKQFLASLNDLLGKNVLLSVDVEVGKGLLGRVQDFSQVAELAFFVQHLVGVAKCFPI
jgi:hypothetical protein